MRAASGAAHQAARTTERPNLKKAYHTRGGDLWRDSYATSSKARRRKIFAVDPHPRKSKGGHPLKNNLPDTPCPRFSRVVAPSGYAGERRQRARASAPHARERWAGRTATGRDAPHLNFKTAFRQPIPRFGLNGRREPPPCVLTGAAVGGEYLTESLFGGGVCQPGRVRGGVCLQNTFTRFGRGDHLIAFAVGAIISGFGKGNGNRRQVRGYLHRYHFLFFGWVWIQAAAMRRKSPAVCVLGSRRVIGRFSFLALVGALSCVLTAFRV